MSIRYHLFLLLLSPLFLWLTLRHYFAFKDSRYLWQRSGFRLPKLSSSVVFHCASVGEVITARPLIERYREKFPHQSIVVSTNTITAARICQQLLPEVLHIYLPLDFAWLQKKFLTHLKPEKLLILETELWPNLYQKCADRNIPMHIINARLSPKTLKAGGWARSLYQRCLSQVNQILCRSEQDATYFQQLGANEEQTTVIGNLKFASAPDSSENFPRPLQRKYVLIASTHKDEEKKLLSYWQQAQYDDLLLVIVPRHPDRRNEIVQQLRPMATELKLRSKQQEVTETTDVYLADTMGELPAFFQHAEFVIIGGSFVDIGGHNMLEPAVFGKAIVYGPSMHNFAAENQLFLQQHAALQIEDAELPATITKLINDVNYRNTLGDNAAKLMQQFAGVADHYLEKISA